MREWLSRLPLAFLGFLLLAIGFAVYLSAMLVAVLRLALFGAQALTEPVAAALWYSSVPTTVGLVLVALDLFVLFPGKRSRDRRIDGPRPVPTKVAVALTCFNDAASIAQSVRDFVASERVHEVLVVDNNSTDESASLAAAAGAHVVIERRPEYGSCVYRCLTELSRLKDVELVVLCEGDCTYRAADIEKLLAFAQHADIVNGTRIVEQLRATETQLSAFMYYGNFFVGKLLEMKHLGRGTFTDVGTTYKLLRHSILADLLPGLDPRVDLEFNAHLMDRALELGLLLVECPVTFHPRVGVSKGGNVSNLRALRVGVRMIGGFLLGWSIIRSAEWSSHTEAPPKNGRKA